MIYFKPVLLVLDHGDISNTLTRRQGKSENHNKLFNRVILLLCVTITVEPLIKDPPRRDNLSTKDTFQFTKVYM